MAPRAYTRVLPGFESQRGNPIQALVQQCAGAFLFFTPSQPGLRLSGLTARESPPVAVSELAFSERHPPAPRGVVRWVTISGLGLAVGHQPSKLHSRVQVWSSPRLPANWEERQILLMEARNMLTRGLMAKGLIGG